MFTQYPNSRLVHPASDPAELVAHLGTMESEAAIHAAHACLASEAWGHLAAMSQAGFDLAANHGLDHGDAKVSETLLHRCLRLHLYANLASRLENLLNLGADPQTFSGQNITAMGLLCLQSKDLPPHRTQEAFAVLSRFGVRMSDRCRTGQWPSDFLLTSDHAFEVIANRCPELAAWARSVWETEILDAKTAMTSPSLGPRGTRL